MSLERSIAQRLLPVGVYQRLAASDVAKRLARGSVWSVFGAGTSRLLVLAGMILLARILGQTEFGEFGMIQSTIVVAGMMAGLGLGSTATRFVAQHAKNDPERAGRIIALVTSSALVLIGVAGAIIALGSGYLAREALNAPHLKTALILGTLLMVAMMLRSIQSGVLAGVERFNVIAKLNVLEGLLSLLGTVLLAGLFGIEGGLLGLSLAIFATWFVGRHALLQTLRDHKINVTYKNSWQERGILTSYSIPTFLANSMVSPIIWYCLTLVAKRPGGYGDLAVYQAAYQWHGPIMFIPLTLNAVSIPILVQQWESASFQRFRQIYLWNAGFLLLISALPVLTITVLSPWFMNFYGDAFRNGWPILILLVVAAPLNALARMATTALFGMHRAWSVFWLNVISSATLLVFATTLIPQMGAFGLASSFLSAYVVLALLATTLVFWHLRKTNQRAMVGIEGPNKGP